MGTGARRAGAGTVSLEGMASLEPFTLRDIGSAEVFQTGETFEGAPLIDYQHPHDLIMRIAGSYARPAGATRLTLSAAVVGEPALGPTAFMHRASAAPNPTVPLGHHQLDSTHVTPGVVTAGLSAHGWGVEASAFHGREPDENRLDLDLGPLDSWSTRVSWTTPGGGALTGRRLYAQASGGRVHDPDPMEPGDQTKLTASMEFTGPVRAREAALTLAWGQNRSAFANEDAWLAEGTLRIHDRGTAYLRGEIVDKHILEAGGLHPPGFQHPHIISTVGALTVGYLHELVSGRGGSLGAGGDASVYYTPANIYVNYEHPYSFHLFLRWSPR
jgi:hypothetical protein